MYFRFSDILCSTKEPLQLSFMIQSHHWRAGQWLSCSPMGLAVFGAIQADLKWPMIDIVLSCSQHDTSHYFHSFCLWWYLSPSNLLLSIC